MPRRGTAAENIQDREWEACPEAFRHGDTVRDVSLFEDAVRRQRISRPKFAKALAKVLPHLDIEIVKRSDQVSGFVVLPKRWIVERTIAWLNRCEGSPRIGRISTERRSRSCASPQSASCQKTLQSGLKSSGRTLMNRMACSVDINPPPRIHSILTTISSPFQALPGQPSYRLDKVGAAASSGHPFPIVISCTVEAGGNS